MIRSTIARALLGVAGLGIAGCTTALAAAPSVTGAPAATSARRHHQHPHLNAGVVTRVTDKELVIDLRHGNDKKAASAAAVPTAALPGDSRSYELSSKPVVRRQGDKDHRLGLDAVKVGDRVVVRYGQKAGHRNALSIILLPDLRAGKVTEKSADSFTIKTAKGDSIKVTDRDFTRFIEGRTGKAAGSFNDMKVGQKVVVRGKADGQDNFDAWVVRYFTPTK
ncbi:MAG: hypothetical protein ACYDGR_13125 [Candidatus Dormibacteria bacterium]